MREVVLRMVGLRGVGVGALALVLCGWRSLEEEGNEDLGESSWRRRLVLRVVGL